jgi:hypothetical protein
MMRPAIRCATSLKAVAGGRSLMCAPATATLETLAVRRLVSFASTGKSIISLAKRPALFTTKQALRLDWQMDSHKVNYYFQKTFGIRTKKVQGGLW